MTLAKYPEKCLSYLILIYGAFKKEREQKGEKRSGMRRRKENNREKRKRYKGNCFPNSHTFLEIIQQMGHMLVITNP